MSGEPKDLVAVIGRIEPWVDGRNETDGVGLTVWELRLLLEAARAGGDLQRLKAWVADLQSGMYVNCVYCGHRYGPGETTPVSMADALKAHIAQCPEHPMSELIKTLTAASHALKSYAHGNAAPDLAKSVSKAADAALARAKAPQERAS